MPINIAIDGPAGAGKSTVAKKLAEDTVQEALQALEIFDERADFLRGLVKYLIARDK